MSTILGAAIKSERDQSAWSEGVAIWVAVIVVSGVGERLLAARTPARSAPVELRLALAAYT